MWNKGLARTTHRHQTGIPAQPCTLLCAHQHILGLRSFELGEWAGFHTQLLAVTITGSYSRTGCSLWTTKGVCVPTDPCSSVCSAQGRAPKSYSSCYYICISPSIFICRILTTWQKLTMITWDMMSAFELHRISLVQTGACPGLLPLALRISFHHKVIYNHLWI